MPHKRKKSDRKFQKMAHFGSLQFLEKLHKKMMKSYYRNGLRRTFRFLSLNLKSYRTYKIRTVSPNFEP